MISLGWSVQKWIWLWGGGYSWSPSWIGVAWWCLWRSGRCHLWISSRKGLPRSFFHDLASIHFQFCSQNVNSHFTMLDLLMSSLGLAVGSNFHTLQPSQLQLRRTSHFVYSLVEWFLPGKCITTVFWHNPIIPSSTHQISTHMYSKAVSIESLFMGGLTLNFAYPPPYNGLSPHFNAEPLILVFLLNVCSLETSK